ncbi:MAG: hypothetical protein IT285_09515 [Bdellovibrionales bacterium]|nr:hypothetical protein [Bdellovibrionales bacterium]
MMPPSAQAENGLDAEIRGIRLLIQGGRTEEAAAAFTKALKRRIKRRHLRWLANIAWRLEMPEKALSLLARHVRSHGRKAAADKFEKMEYGVALIEAGAYDEGFELLGELTPSDFPELLLFRSFYHFHRHDHAAAIPLLEELIMIPGRPGPNGKLNAKIFLASALEHADADLGRAAHLLEEVIAASTPSIHGYAHRNALLILAQVRVHQGLLDEAERALAGLESVCRSEKNIFGTLLLPKWRAILALRRASSAADRREAALALEAIRAGLRGTPNEWRARRCDAELARCAGDRDAFLRAYFGTPALRYREKIARELGFEVPDSYRFTLFSKPGSEAPVVVSAIDGINTAGAARLPTGGAPQRLFRALCADFYRGLRIAEICEALYPGEYFNPQSSPLRAQQVIRRLRDWFRQAGVPLVLTTRANVYRLEATAPCEIEVPSPSVKRAPRHALLLGLIERFGLGWFTAGDLAAARGMSSRSSLRLLKQALEAGFLERKGRTRGASYRVQPSPELLRTLADEEWSASGTSASNADWIQPESVGK